MKFYRAIIFKLTGALILLAVSLQMAFAGMTIAGTRIIFPGDEREQTIRTTNKGSVPLLVQVWTDDGSKNEDINKLKVPFTVTPPVYRVEPGKGQSIRLIYNGMTLPQDRESVFWFNLLEIPPVKETTKETDRLELAFRTRIKIFYRPSQLKSTSAQEGERLRWEVIDSGKGIKVTNPTPYYFSFDSASLTSGTVKHQLQVDMVPPFASKTFTLAAKAAVGVVNRADVRLINDYGSVIEHQLVYSQGQGLILNKQNK